MKRTQEAGRGLSHRMATTLLLAGVCTLTPWAITTASGEATPVSVAQRAGVQGAALPIKQIVLYRSGVGYFERVGSVRGDQSVSLRFESSQINDILKSMTLVELDPKAGGSVAGITYGSKEPLARRLRSFGVDVSGAPSIAALFMQLRGSESRVSTPEGEIAGVILSVESRLAPTAEGKEPYSRTFVNLVTSSGVRSVSIESILSFRLANDELNSELTKALAALEEERVERLKTLDIAYTGPQDKAREVLVAYVNEAPVWKTSYRLVLPEQAAQGKSSDKVTLQGWAIVENTTEEDWENVRLTLASGRPVSFTMDLHSPLYSYRPDIPPPVEQGVAPRVYEGGMGMAKDALADMDRSETGGLTRDGRGMADESSARASRSTMRSGMPAISAPSEIAYNVAASMTSAAWGGEVGEQFVYTIDAPVTLERQRSAMLPILATPITGRRVSIYNAQEDPQRARRGVQFTNDSGLHLIPGPITVLDGSAYAGDAQIAHTARNDKRLLAYAVDLDVKAAQETTSDRTVTKLRIVQGTIETTSKTRQSTQYTFENLDSSRSRMMLVEHPISHGYELVETPKPVEKTDTLYRFEVPVDSGKAAKLAVVQETVNYQRVAIVGYPLPTLVAYAAQGKVSKAVVDAVRQAGEMQAVINTLNETLARNDRDRNQISTEQGRIRENMRIIERTTELYARFMTKLNEQETLLEQLHEERARVEAEKDRKQNELNVFVASLNIQ